MVIGQSQTQVNRVSKTVKDRRDSKVWWDKIKRDSKRFENWLQKQYHGEMRAAVQLGILAEQFKKNLFPKQLATLDLIAEQETKHASWLLKMLRDRGITPKKTHQDRYWKNTLKWKNFDEAAAVAFHAETMRLERIRVIAEDITAPWDVRTMFTLILKDETFHAKAFQQMSTDKARSKALVGHKKGREALGLTA